jgi:hypothetical protein
MTAASIYGSPQKLLWGNSTRRTRFPWAETGVFGEATDMCNQRGWRGMGPSIYARVAEIMSGRAISQQGLTATCKDPVGEGEPEPLGGIWSGAWAHRSCEGGVTPSEATLEVVPTSGNARCGQRSPGHSVAKESEHEKDMAGETIRSNFSWSVDTSVVPLTLRRGGRQTIETRGVCESALELPSRWAGPSSDKCRAEPRSEPDSGNPTVRDRREALRNVTKGAGLRPGAKATEQPPDPKVRALNFYLDNRTHGSIGGRWRDELPTARWNKHPKGNPTD